MNHSSHRNKFDRTYACFTLTAPDVHPDEITAGLAQEPTRAFAKGDEYVGHVDRNTTRVLRRGWGLWQLSSYDKVTSDDPREHLEYLLAQLGPSRTFLAPLLTRSDYRLMVSVYYVVPPGSLGFYVPNSILARLGEISHETYFTFFETEQPSEQASESEP